MSDHALMELRELGQELSQAFADERRAIAALDHERLEALAEHKTKIAYRLAEIREAALATGSPAVRDLFIAIRLEAQSTAILAATAANAVRAMLGYETSTTYDRRAKPTTNRIPRILAAY